MAHARMDRSVDRHKRLALEVLGQFRLIYGVVRTQYREIEKTCGISGSQLWLLREIKSVPNIGVSELAARLSIHQSTCSLLVQKLVRRRFVTRVRLEDDQRRVGLTLSKSGAAALRRARGPAEGVLPRAIMDLKRVQLNALRSRLDEVIDRLGAHDERYRNEPLADL